MNRMQTALQEIYNLTQQQGYIRTERINEIAKRALAEHNNTPEIHPVPFKDLGFDGWWSAYNKKVGKTAALKAWRKLSKDDQHCAAVDIIDNKRPTRDPAWTVSGGRYQPNASTYLTNHRWEDEWRQSTEQQVKFV